MPRTQLRRLAIASLGLGVGFASAGALAQADAGAAGAGAAGAGSLDLGGTSLFQTTVATPGTLSGTAPAPTDPNAPQSATARRPVDAEALAELLRGDNGLSLTFGRNPLDFAPHFALQPSDSGRRLGQTQFFGGTQTNVDTGAVGGAGPAQTGANSAPALFRGDNGLGVASGQNPQGFTPQQSSKGRGAGQAQLAADDDLNGKRLGQLRRSVEATTAAQVASAKSALVANTIADQVASAKSALVASTIVEEVLSANNALVANAIATANVNSTATVPGTTPASSNEGSPAVVVAASDNGLRLGQAQPAALDDFNGKLLGQLRRSGSADHPGIGPVSLGDGSPEVLAAAPSPVPEPANLLLLALGLLVLGARAVMRRGR